MNNRYSNWFEMGTKSGAEPLILDRTPEDICKAAQEMGIIPVGFLGPVETAKAVTAFIKGVNYEREQQLVRKPGKNVWERDGRRIISRVHPGWPMWKPAIPEYRLKYATYYGGYHGHSEWAQDANTALALYQRERGVFAID